MNNIFVISFNCFLFFYSFRHSFLSSVHSFRHFVIHFVRHFVAREESKVLVDWWSKKKNKKAETCWKERWKDYIAQQYNFWMDICGKKYYYSNRTNGKKKRKTNRKQTNQPLRDGHGQMDMVNVSLLVFTYCSIYSTKPNPYERI